MKTCSVLAFISLLIISTACCALTQTLAPSPEVNPSPTAEAFHADTPSPTDPPPAGEVPKTDIPPSLTPTNPLPAEESEIPENNNRPNADEVGYDDDGRPILSGAEILLDTEHFRVHYTLDGRDAVSTDFVSAAGNANGQHPDYVDQVAQSLEYVWQVEIEQFGWAAPPPDEGIGGDDRYDIYLQEILADGTFGYTEGSDERYRAHDQSGDNPNTDGIETRAVTSYIVLDNDYAGAEDFALESYTTLDIMRSTVAHEFNHAIQFGYDGEEPADWLWEATATWMQDEVYDNVNDGIEDIYAVAKSPDTCQLAYGGETRVEDENHWYGEWIFIRYISEHHGHETVRAIWEHAVQFDGYEAIEAALSDAGTTLDETFRGFSVALLTRAFEEGADYPTVRLEGEMNQAEAFIPTDGVGQMGADYVEIKFYDTVQVTLNTTELEGLLVGIAGDEASVFTMGDNQAIVNAGQFDYLYLLIINLNQAESEYDCQNTTYTVNVQAASQSGSPQSPDTYPSPNFEAPEVEDLLDPEEYWGEDWEEGASGSIDAPAELIPTYLPPDYELVDAFPVEAEEYGEDAIWYIPGGGTAIEIDFYGPGEEDVIAITASESPYASLDGWLDEAGFEPSPEEDQNINGVRVIIEDYTDDEGIYSFATYILGDQFIVVEGNISVGEIEKVVESLVGE